MAYNWISCRQLQLQPQQPPALQLLQWQQGLTGDGQAAGRMLFIRIEG